jgi:hypothetical protein
MRSNGLAHERRRPVLAHDDRATRGLAGGKGDRKGNSALEPGRSGLAELLECEAGGTVRLDSSPALLTAEKVLVEAPLPFWGELAGQEGDDGLLRTRHG